jgi:hypothetical protein
MTFHTDRLTDHFKICEALREAVIELVEEVAEEYPVKVEDLWKAWVVEHHMEDDVEVLSKDRAIFFKCIKQDCQCPADQRECSVKFYSEKKYFCVYHYDQHLIKFNPNVEDDAIDILFLGNKMTIFDVVNQFQNDGLHLCAPSDKNVAAFIACKNCASWKYLYQSDGAEHKSTGSITSNLRSHVNSAAHIRNSNIRKAHKGGLLKMGFTCTPSLHMEKISSQHLSKLL